MSVFAPEKLVADYQSGVAAWFAIARPAIRGFEAVVELNLQATKTALAEYEDKLKDALNTTNPIAGFAQRVAAPQEAAGKAVAYGRHLFDIAVSTQVEWTKVAHEQYEQADLRMKDVIGELTKHAPAGSAPVVAVLNSALSAASAAAESVRAAAGQAMEAAQSSFETAGETAGETAARTGKQVAATARKEAAGRETAA
ncbi:TIGR01841 family phasin [Burkholderia multivorans]|uniref:TIGR01841 family phasin n=1 Tax=Burkholderia multivorans TaxID=87883 RepID=UPI001C22808F|nr:TIGR01841 family phasin [Burkholderia multivorans]MBU9370400.1 TIGR01841 family phasin [Burkholderia multivorans]MBU9413416.1 TIGR01841 family phasin [Burkholderia multivorans]UQO99898.1 TIGR01841 family phasin [Burkholderia multivorans]UXZ82012.1 TIGR01841 family phasin [Burkholderia multivorans]HEF4745740.1 TIGR01841 family phasin [Burkholderia multivorans]